VTTGDSGSREDLLGSRDIESIDGLGADESPVILDRVASDAAAGSAAGATADQLTWKFVPVRTPMPR